jgi:hypothetical protein
MARPGAERSSKICRKAFIGLGRQPLTCVRRRTYGRKHIVPAARRAAASTAHAFSGPGTLGAAAVESRRPASGARTRYTRVVREVGTDRRLGGLCVVRVAGTWKNSPMP